MLFGRRKAPSTAHGSATWNTDEGLRDAGLLSGQGVVLCQTSDARFQADNSSAQKKWQLLRPGRLVTHDGPEHVMVFAPTGSGKGIGTVVPTLLSWRQSVVAYDIKRELWNLTAGWRRQFSRCWCFEPTATNSVRFNPLFEVRKGPAEVRDVQNIIDILVDPDGKAEKRDHWKTSAMSLLEGVILHVLYSEPDKSLAGVARFIANPEMSIDDTLSKMLVTPHLPSGPHPVIASCARGMLNKSENELSGVVSTASTFLNLFSDPIIAANTRTSDFAITDIMNADVPVSLYLVIPPSDIERTKPLVRLMLNQFGKRLTEKISFSDEPAYRHRLLLLLDEFPSLGRLDFFQTQLAFIRGYGIKAFLICQSLNQLEGTYGPHNSILDNCAIRMTYTAADEKTAKRISDLVGTGTHVKTQRSFSGGGLFRRVSESEQEHARPLLTPDEILTLPFDDALLFAAGAAPYRARKLMYYLDPRLRNCVKLKPPESERQRRNELLPGRGASEWESGPLSPAGATNHSPSGAPSVHPAPAPALAVSHANAPGVVPPGGPPPEPQVSHAKPDLGETDPMAAFASFWTDKPDQEPTTSTPPTAGPSPTPSTDQAEDDLPL